MLGASTASEVGQDWYLATMLDVTGGEGNVNDGKMDTASRTSFVICMVYRCRSETAPAS